MITLDKKIWLYRGKPMTYRGRIVIGSPHSPGPGPGPGPGPEPTIVFNTTPTLSFTFMASQFVIDTYGDRFFEIEWDFSLARGEDVSGTPLTELDQPNSYFWFAPAFGRPYWRVTPVLSRNGMRIVTASDGLRELLQTCTFSFSVGNNYVCIYEKNDLPDIDQYPPEDIDMVVYGSIYFNAGTLVKPNLRKLFDSNSQRCYVSSLYNALYKINDT